MANSIIGKLIFLMDGPGVESYAKYLGEQVQSGIITDEERNDTLQKVLVDNMTLAVEERDITGPDDTVRRFEPGKITLEKR
jgi:hypothetical protein